ncbi:MAG: Aromatic amino acid permease [Parcubacteria group bacterium GW2011_GWB1_52_7]|nr:MAG: Aromatic amino acid permease [Parcubacteria group bacterium GW2011_GWA1_51_12]KKW28995.1 MAG: Aromatic amino acid permease [Parcubacteria group bacterium GW2011_GWB1_52_7]KKW31647.1 MAG: Aromatic amino acid permease [Parcubacteria group bacterium GW2011_GWC2_52_8c]
MLSRYWQGLLLLVGTIVGVGVFTLPFLISKAGFIWGSAMILVLAGAMTLVHLMYGDVVAATPARHRLPGYAAIYLGKKWQTRVTVSHALALTGTMVAYLLLGSVFLVALISPIFPGFSALAGMAVFFLIGAAVFSFDSSFSTDVEGWLTIFLVLALLAIIGVSLPHADTAIFSASDPAKLPLAYGAILFALTGTPVIPRVFEAFGRNVSGFRSLLVIGTVMPSLLYLGFVFGVMSTSAGGVSKEAISGMAQLLGPRIMLLGSAVGFLATITSFIGIGLTYKGFLQFDLGVPKRLAWILALVAPFILIGAGVSDFIAVVSFIGAVAIGLDNITLIRLWRKLPRHKLVRSLPAAVWWALLLMFGAGIIYEMFRFASSGALHILGA